MASSGRYSSARPTTGWRRNSHTQPCKRSSKIPNACPTNPRTPGTSGSEVAKSSTARSDKHSFDNYRYEKDVAAELQVNIAHTNLFAIENLNSRTLQLRKEK